MQYLGWAVLHGRGSVFVSPGALHPEDKSRFTLWALPQFFYPPRVLQHLGTWSRFALPFPFLLANNTFWLYGSAQPWFGLRCPRLPDTRGLAFGRFVGPHEVPLPFERGAGLLSSSPSH